MFIRGYGYDLKTFPIWLYCE